MLRNKIQKEIQGLVPKGIDFSVQVSERKQHGDYSTNVALVLAKQKKKDPIEVAGRLAGKLGNKNIFEKVEVAGPGFINFWLSDKILTGKFLELASRKGLQPPNIGRGKKVQVELISANPTGPLHIGHGRMAFYSDVLSRLLSAVGYKVTREYYINDSKESNQIKELGKSILGKGKVYKGEHLIKVAKRLKNKKFKNEGEAGYMAAHIIQQQNKDFITKDLEIKIDLWTSEENDLRKKGYFEKAKKAVQKYSYEKDGALWVKTSKFGDDEDRVIIRSDGTPTYFLADIAYFLYKKDKKVNYLIPVWGADHQGHIKRIYAMQKMLKWKMKIEFLISQLVSLKGGERMSKRRGTIVWLEDLIDKVSLDVSRWFFLEKSLNTHMEFDLDLALQQSQKNPVFYVQYAHARMASILKNAKNKTQKIKFEIKNLEPAERELIKKLLEVNGVLEETVKDYQLHRLTNYAYELAYAFSVFYRDVKVIDSGDNEAYRLALVKTTKQALKNILDLLGIESPDKM